MSDRQYKARKATLNDQLVDKMIALVEQGRWEPGDRLPNEIELAASFEVSRNIMREAMKILRSYGILEGRAGLGTIISPDALVGISNMRFFEKLKNNTSVRTMLESRLVIEPDLTYYACVRSTDEEIAELDRIMHEKAEHWKVDTYFYQEDFDFHLTMARLSRNDMLAGLVSTLLDQLRNSDYGQYNRYTRAEEYDLSLNDHLRILEAMKKRDAEMARHIMYNHLIGRMKIINPDYPGFPGGGGQRSLSPQKTAP